MGGYKVSCKYGPFLVWLFVLVQTLQGRVGGAMAVRQVDHDPSVIGHDRPTDNAMMVVMYVHGVPAAAKLGSALLVEPVFRVLRFVVVSE